ncbi:MAG: hypothetical protein R6U92_01125 [Bacillota bacterium]
MSAVSTPVLEGIEKRSLTANLKEIIVDLKKEPEFSWSSARTTFAIEDDGSPAVKVAIANCGVDFDPWSRLRNPAMIGLHPLNFRELWDFYAMYSTERVDRSGRATLFPVPENYDEAIQRFGRVLMVPVMLPVAQELADEYASSTRRGGLAPVDVYLRSMTEITRLLDAAVTRMAYRLMTPNRTVLAMTTRAVARMSEMSVPATRRGQNHGACKGGNYPQKSVAVLAGLGQFGAHRLVIRDEMVDGKPKRFMGPIRSLVIFDPEDPEDSDGVQLLTEGWRESLFDLHSDRPEASPGRYCQHYTGDPKTACSACFDACPSEAVAYSSADADGEYPEEIRNQTHRFWDDALQFDFRRCLERRSQMEEVYDEWLCGRCLAACVSLGSRNPGACR